MWRYGAGVPLALPEPTELLQLIDVATPDEKAELSRLLELSVALSSPLDFAVYASPEGGKVQRLPHTELLNEYLVALFDHALYPAGSAADLLHPELPEGISDPAIFIEGLDPEDPESGDFYHPTTGEQVLYNLAISMPPQHGKSLIVSHYMPAWFLIKNPTKNAAIISYEDTFATSWTAKVRQVIDDHPEFGVFLDPSTQAKGEWMLKEYGGVMLSAGAAGPLTGRPLHLTGMDDLIKNSDDARSPTKRKGIQDWWPSVAKARNQSPRNLNGTPEAGVRVLMHTRWHEDDLIGFTQRTEGDEWYYLNLPALAEVDDPLGREVGQALAPKLHSRKILLQRKNTGDPADPGSGGEAWFNALYQGHPSTAGSGIFHEPWHYYVKKSNKYEFSDGYVCYDEDLRRFTTVDLAATTKTSSDFTVFMEFGQAPDGRLLVLDIYRERMESTDHEDELRGFVAKKRRQLFIGIERVTYGITLIQNMLRHPPFLPLRELTADKDKVSRAIPAGQAIANAKVWWSMELAHRPEFEAELLAFDNGAHDDMVDTLSYGVQEWEKMPMKFGPETQDWDTSAEARVRRMRVRQKKEGKRRKRRQGSYNPVTGDW